MSENDDGSRIDGPAREDGGGWLSRARLLVVSVIDNLLYPALVGKRLRLHTLPVFIAIVGGIMLFGASGLILDPVALALTMALVDVWRRRTAGGRTAETGVEGGAANR